MSKRLEKNIFSLDIASLKNFLRFKVFVSKKVIDNKKRFIVNFVKTFKK